MLSDELAKRISELQELASQRRGLIRAKNRLLLQAKAVTRRYLGWYSGDDEAGREKVNQRAKRIVDAVFDGKQVSPDDAAVAGAIGPQLLVWKAMLDPAVSAISNVEKRMIKLTKGLPGESFVKGVTGFGPKTFAILIGETGDLSAYPKKGHVWKRLGLAPVQKDGVVKACSRWRIEGGLSADAWSQAGYRPQRRAEVYACLEESLAKHQLISAEKSETAYGSPAGRYGEIYVRRRERTAVAHSDWTKGHARADALRVMAKAVIKDLWRAWRTEQQAVVDLPVEAQARQAMPAAQPIDRDARKNLPPSKRDEASYSVHPGRVQKRTRKRLALVAAE